MVGCYLSDDVQDVVGAVKFVLSTNKAIPILVETDVNMCVYLLNMSDLLLQVTNGIIESK